MGTYRLRVPASRVGYVPEAQGGLPPGPRVLYVLGTRTSLGRTVRTACRGTQALTGCPYAEQPDTGLAVSEARKLQREFRSKGWNTSWLDAVELLR